MFSVITEPFGPLNQIKLINTTTGEYAAIIPDYGALLNALVLKKGPLLHDIIDGNENYDYLTTQGLKLCKGFVLFPYPNRIDKGFYSFKNTDYKLIINEPDRDNAIHGLSMKTKFKIIQTQSDEHKAEVVIVHEEKGDNPGYPFKVRLTIIYTLTTISGLTCKSIIENLDSTEIPVGLGWHPYLKTGSKVDTLEIQIPSNHALIANERMIPKSDVFDQNKYETKSLLMQAQLDTGYKLAEEEGIAVTELFDHKQDISIKVWQKTGKDKFNYVQIYTPLHRNSIAIEPMSCATNAFNNHMGLITLFPKEAVTLEYGIILS